jgi:hypothetical protein
MKSADEFSNATGPMPSDTATSNASTPLDSPAWISSAEDSHAKTSRARAADLASLALEAAFGTNSLASLRRAALDGSSSKTCAAAPSNGSISCAETWNGSAMRRYRSRLRRAIAELPTNAHAFSSSGVLPTLTAQSYGSNIGGSAGRTGKVRLSLQRLLPTLTCNRSTYATRRGERYETLPVVAGGPLNPTWCEWYMGFPAGWTEHACSAMP